MTNTTTAISPMTKNVLSIAKIPPIAMKPTQMARITPRIAHIFRPMYLVCARRASAARGHADSGLRVDYWVAVGRLLLGLFARHVRTTVSTQFYTCHAAGMGPVGATLAVVDRHCQLCAIPILRTVDASVTPAISRANISLSCITVAEHVAG